jgi:parvulin-like peptidyl-prolyl isomerase
MAKPTRKPPRLLSPKHRVGLERELFVNRLLLIGTIVIVLIVVGLVGWSSFYQYVLGPSQTVAVVEGHEIKGGEYQARVRLNRNQLVNTYLQYVQMLQLFGGDPNFQQQAYTELTQIQYQLFPEVIGGSTINQMVDDELIKLEAAEMGISISQEQVDEEMASFIGYYAQGVPTSSPTSTPIVTSTLSETQLAIVTLTPTFTPFPSATSSGPAATPTRRVINPTATPTLTPQPTATEYTFEAFQTEEANYFEFQKDNISVSEQGIRDVVYINLLRLAMLDVVAADVGHTEEQVWARHILVEDEETARDVLERLEAGEDWAELALEYSTDLGNASIGGDLGWFGFDEMVAPFAEAAFNLRIGEISDPVETQFGFHIIQVIGNEDRALTASQYEERRQQQFQEFLGTLRDKYEWEIFDTWVGITPEDPRIPPSAQLQ